MKKNDLISIIIRTMPGREKFLDKCLFILSGQIYKNIEPIIVVQKLKNEDSLEKIETIASKWKLCFSCFQLLSHTSAQDARSHSLNLGMEMISGRYFAFLDDDDKLYPHHYSLLIENLKRTSYAWCYSDVVLAKYNEFGQLVSRTLPFKREGYSFLKHLCGNFIPIHSFVIDRHRVKDLGKVDESLDRIEDYDFLLRLAFRNKPLYIENISSEYCVRTDGSNTTVLGSENIDAQTELYEKKQKWNEAELKLNQKKIQNFGWWIKEVESLSSQHLHSGVRINYKGAKNNLKNIYKSISWKSIRIFKKINWKLRGRKKKRDIVPKDDLQAVEILLKIYSSKSWLIISPLYAIESYIRKF